MNTVCDWVQAENCPTALDLPGTEDVIRAAGVSRSSAYRVWPYREDMVHDVTKELVRRFVQPDQGLYGERLKNLGHAAIIGAKTDDIVNFRPDLVQSISSDEVRRIQNNPVLPRLRHIIESLPEESAEVQVTYQEAVSARNTAVAGLYEAVTTPYGMAPVSPEHSFTGYAASALALAEAVATNPSLQSPELQSTLFMTLDSQYVSKQA